LIKNLVDERAITLDLSVEVWQAHPRKLGYCEATNGARGGNTACPWSRAPAMHHLGINGGRGPFFEPRAAARGRDPQ
jgi:hypothetical protein